jgi:hypothetical protein
MAITEVVIRKGPVVHRDGSRKIRERALRDYVKPALRNRQRTLTIPVKDLMKKLEAEGFPKNRPAQFCSALQERHFLQEHGLEVERIEGPPSGKSTTVVLHFRLQSKARPEVDQPGNHDAPRIKDGDTSEIKCEETPRQRAERFVGSLRGLLKNEIAAYGGTEAFIRWVRSEDEA